MKSFLLTLSLLVVHVGGIQAQSEKLHLCCPKSALLSYPENIHLSWTGSDVPDTKTTMAITWVNASSQSNQVRYGTESGVLTLSATAAAAPSGISAKPFAFKAELMNLSPATTYYYKCGSDEKGWSDIHSFKTAPVPGERKEFTIGVWGDTQNNEGNTEFEVTQTIVKKLATYPLDLSIHMGDIVETGSAVQSWNLFLTTSQPLNAKVPFMPVAGNHDVDNKSTNSGYQKPHKIFYDLFNLPRDFLNYSFDYGNIHFVAINSGVAHGAAAIDELLFKEGSAEYVWLNNDLAEARKNKNIDWIIVYAHYPIYAFGVSMVPAWQQQIAPILDKYQVDLCLAGHRHVYERHKAIFSNVIEEQQQTNVYHKPGGTVYITNGSAGGSLQGVGGSSMPSMVFTPTVRMYNYAIMKIENLSLSYDVYDAQGNKIDYFRITK